MTKVEELGHQYFNEVCEHSYADTIEQLREDVVSAYVHGYAKRETEEQFKNEQLIKAKEIIRNLLRVTYGEGWNYSLDVKVKAEQFLKENE